MVSIRDKKTIKLIIIFKISIITLVIVLILPVFENRSGIDLITQHFEQMDMFEEPVACIQQFDPVCTIGGVTFPNQCEADVVGARTLYKGVCP